MGQQVRDENGRILGYFLTEAEYLRVHQEIADGDRARTESEARREELPTPDVVVDQPPT